MWWSSMHGVDTLESCWVVLLPTHNIVPHMSLHDQPCHKTMKKYENFKGDSNMVLQLSTKSLLISHGRWVQPKKTWSRKDVSSPESTSFLSTFHNGSRFCFFPTNRHTQMRIFFFHDAQRDIPNLESSPSRVSTGFSQFAFPVRVLPKDNFTFFAKGNDWVFHTGPWFWPFVSWWTNPNVQTLGFGNFW